MADEVKVQIQVVVQNGNFKDTFSPGQQKYDQTTGSGGNPGTVSIGTSEENIAFGDVTPGWIVMQNLDATNFITYGADDASTMKTLGKLQPGGVACFELAAGVTIRALADTATCLVSIKGYAT
jgi:hypothetical protein